uniref:glycosyltransferase family 4 protein n=1 Tax=Algoriphagus sp. TaxID=1872435 RepID=UPI0040485BA9
MIRVLIDARWLRNEKRGIGNFTDSLLEGLSKVSNTDIEITIAIPNSNFSTLNKNKSFSCKFFLIPNLPDPIIDFFYFSYINYKYSFDVVHFTGNSGLLLIRKKCKVLLTLHDVSYMKNSFVVPWPQRTKQIIGRIYRKYSVPIFVRNAQKIVTVSNFALNDIFNEFPTLRDIEYLYHGFDKISQNLVSITNEKSGLVSDNFLVVGGNDPQKNLGTVISAFKSLFYKLGVNAPKVNIIGLTLSDFKIFNPKVILTANINFLGYVESSQVPLLISYSKAVIVASFYESFGLPVIESLFMGKPVICSDRGALPEIGGDAPIYFDPGSIESLLNAIEFFSLNPDRNVEINDWNKLAEDRFSWLKTAFRYSEIYKKLGSS